jgi:flagellum-specific ATP synthase
LAAAEAVRDLVEVGAYQPGTNPDADHGLAVSPNIVELCRQGIDEITPINETFATLTQILREDSVKAAQP